MPIDPLDNWPDYVSSAGNLDPTGDGQPIPSSRTGVRTVNLSLHATGSGTYADPWVGWASAIATPGVTYSFARGFYKAPANWTVTLRHVHLVGEFGAVILGGGGATPILTLGDVTQVDNATMTFDCAVEGLDFNGNHTATVAIDVVHAHHLRFKDLRLYNTTAYGFRSRWMISAVLDNVLTNAQGVDAPDGLAVTVPTCGFRFDADGSAGTTVVTCQNVYAYGHGGNGIEVGPNCFGITFLGGSAEACGGYGVAMDAGSMACTFIGTGFEVNNGNTASSYTASIDGTGHRFVNNVTFLPPKLAGTGHVIEGGNWIGGQPTLDNASHTIIQDSLHGGFAGTSTTRTEWGVTGGNGANAHAMRGDNILMESASVLSGPTIRNSGTGNQADAVLSFQSKNRTGTNTARILLQGGGGDYWNTSFGNDFCIGAPGTNNVRLGLDAVAGESPLNVLQGANGGIQLHAYAGQPAAVAGGMCFTGGHLYFCKDGSTWTQLT
jgi:hypothetical protein